LVEVARALSAQVVPAAVELVREVAAPDLQSRLAVELSGSIDPDDDTRLLWTLLEVSASDPQTLQELIDRLQDRDGSESIGRIIDMLGWRPTDTNGESAGSGVDPLDATLDKLVASEFLTPRRRERIREKMGAALRAEIESSTLETVVNRLVQHDYLDEDEARELLAPDGDGPQE
jgi:hypothetical protein